MNLDELKEMVDRAWENKSLDEIVKASVDALQGIGEKGSEVLNSVLNVKSVEDLANNKYVKNAQDIVKGNIEDLKSAVDKAWESKELQDIANASIDALQGISPAGAEKLREILNIKTVKDLAENVHVKNAQTIVNNAEKPAE